LFKKLRVDFDLSAFPYQLSSGQQQMIAVARNIIEPVDLMVMDEPFSALDYNTTLVMEQKLLEIWRQYRLSILFVTHAAGEAVLLADRVLVLSGNPTGLAADIKISLPRPRPYSIITTQEFNNLKNQVINASFTK
jgi:NitT/TauT family transport system ATP-binding protein